MITSVTKISSLALVCFRLLGVLDPADGFLHVPPVSFSRMRPKTPVIGLALDAQAEDTTAIPDEAAKYRAEAERMRLEAERMDMALTLTKIENIERKLTNRGWVQKHPEEQAELEKKLEDLKKKLSGDGASVSSQKMNLSVAKAQVVDDAEIQPPSGVESTETTSEISAFVQQSKSSPLPQNENPISGFDEEDLELYLPIAAEIEERMQNATVEEKLQAFREAPELQQHFQRKIQAMLVQPMEDMQRLDELKNQYLCSTSSVEKEQLKREIRKLEKAVENEGPFAYSDSLSLELPPMPDEELQERIEAIEKLPPVLQALYKKRTGAGEDGDLQLAILLDYYDHQIQLLDQIRLVLPLTDEMRSQAIKSLKGLPSLVRDHVARGVGLENGDDIDALLKELSSEGNDPAWKMLTEVVEAASQDTNPPEYRDIDFIDRSRYVEELYPGIARLEDQHPSSDVIDQFLKEVVDKKSFMVNSQAERVTGGYYIRGENLISDDESGKKLVERLEKNLAASSLNDKIDFFFIPDPAPLSDEQVELGYGEQPVILVTTKNDTLLYDHAAPLTKGVVSTLGILSVAIFALTTCQLEPALQERLDAAIEAQEQDISWLTDIANPVFYSMLAIQLAHEAGHQIVALKDKFKIGIPTPLPSIQLGLLGAITPLKSPPPNLKSMFDFAMAGPLLGMVVSLGFLLQGLALTAAMDLNQAVDLPALPVFMLRSSALGGELVEFFLGSGALMAGLGDDALVSMHPYAIAGFAGVVANALALLPLGRTDGGRIALAMFGRRGAFIVKSFTAFLICAGGLFGLDSARILILYILFTIIWQRELETPARNEVEQLDFARGLVGIVSALLVALALLPMP